MQNISKRLNIFVPIFLSIILIVSFITPFIQTSEKISNDVFRLHILANSDSVFDQKIKYLVRDSILEAGQGVFENCKSLEETIETANKNTDYFKSVAEKCIEDNGANFPVSITVDKEYFNTRVYDTITLPSGIYNALKIEIGAGRGHNWWCVMFPAICLPSVEDEEINTVLSDDEMKIVFSSKYDPRFKIVEIYENLKSKSK